jgi:hypothetical protein
VGAEPNHFSPKPACPFVDASVSAGSAKSFAEFVAGGDQDKSVFREMLAALLSPFTRQMPRGKLTSSLKHY